MYTPLFLVLFSSAFAAPLIKVDSTDAVAGKYIVKLKGDVTSQAEEELTASIAANIDFKYTMSGFMGFAGSISDQELTRLRASEHARYSSQDARVHVFETKTQLNATWGLGRISHIKPGQNSYLYDSTAGEGTCVYVVDTGIETTHPEFEGRAYFLADFSEEGDQIDGAGHGTHVAGTIGSLTWGVAKKTTLFAVRVLDSFGTGTNAGVLAGMQFVITDAKERMNAGDCPKGALANMSLGGRKSQVINDVAAVIVAAGIFLGVAAGNEGTLADYSSPSSEPTVCTVAATANNDTLIEWSNYGPRVDILAPGVEVTSTWIGGGINTISGTSMATPHVVGVAAYFAGLGARVECLCEHLASTATKGAIDDRTLHEGTPNALVYNQAEGIKHYGTRTGQVV
ncbi:Cuticle-degrading protease [Alternaria gaisen]|uniref:Cuticle-degrading protease n=1 Tax=Alternaria gaisen TaxID=167740 RepID=A0ACB6G4D2_9PLEO|nr:Cuticle-degrading protease [Alternaria gaisen]